MPNASFVRKIYNPLDNPSALANNSDYTHSIALNGDEILIGSKYIQDAILPSRPYYFSGVCSATTLLADLATTSAYTTQRITTSSISASASSITYSPVGTATGLSYYDFNGSTDDNYLEVVLPFNVNFNGTSYSSVFFGTNGYVTFGEGSTAYSQLNSFKPPLDKIMVLAGDHKSTAIWYGIEGTAPNRTLRVIQIFDEGLNGTDPANSSFNFNDGTSDFNYDGIMEYKFYESTPNQIDLTIGDLNYPGNILTRDFSGVVYVFNKNTGELDSTFHNPNSVYPSSDHEDQFGAAVAASSSYYAISAIREVDEASNTYYGVIYVYDSNKNLLYDILPHNNVANTPEIGNDLYISGNYLIASDYDTSTNSYLKLIIYNISNGSLLGIIDFSDNLYSGYYVGATTQNYSIDVSGNNLIVGSKTNSNDTPNTPRAWVYDISTITTTNAPTHIIDLDTKFTTYNNTDHPISIDGTSIALSFFNYNFNSGFSIIGDETNIVTYDLNNYTLIGSIKYLNPILDFAIPSTLSASFAKVKLYSNWLIVVQRSSTGTQYIYDKSTGALLNTFSYSGYVGGQLGVNMNRYALRYDGSTLLIVDDEDVNPDSDYKKFGSVSVYNLPYNSTPFNPTHLLAFFP